jgi:hypothetical protein
MEDKFMQTEHNIKLTSAEISQLWSAYMNDSMSICILHYFLDKVEDVEIRPILEYALELAQAHLQKISFIFNNEEFPIPYGFKEQEDIDVTAPPLFSDTYYLYYLQQWGMLGLDAYSISLSLASRSDVIKYFSECIDESKELMKQTVNVLLSKGLYIRAPYIVTPKKVDFIKKQSFLTGWFGERRPLTTLEITNLYANLQRNVIAMATFVGFYQVSNSKEVSRFMKRGKEIASKHIKVYSSILNENALPASVSWDTQVTDSTVSPFSDKLMMFHINAIATRAVGYYGTSLSVSTRRDLSAHYIRIMGEVLKFAEDGTNIMIDNGWMEQPPRVVDHDELANTRRR